MTDPQIEISHCRVYRQGIQPSPVPMALAQTIAGGIAQTIERTRSQRGAAHGYVYAGSWHVCTRAMTYDLIGAPQEPYPTDLLAKFARGEGAERQLIALIDRAGFEADPAFRVIGQQDRYTLKDRKGRIAIVGKVDARLDIQRLPFRPPIEIKNWHPLLTQHVRSFDDVLAHPFMRRGGLQLATYLLATAEPFGYLVLDRPGLPLILPVELDQHLDRVEDFLTRAEAAIDHAQAGTLPPFLDGDAAECQRCSYYGHTCNPPLFHRGATVLTDPELERQLERREELRAGAKEYDRIDNDVKAKLRGIEMGVAGSFIIEGKWGKQSRLDLPADLKTKYTKTDPRGRFTLEITKVG